MSITKQYLEIQEVGACYASHADVCYQISALLLKGKEHENVVEELELENLA